MKQGLSLKVSQHLALTPQLQQSIRLLQLSTLELNQEVEQLLGDNPFLELAEDNAEREDHGLEYSNQAAASDEDAPDFIAARADSTPTSGQNDTEITSNEEPTNTEPQDWEGDGSVELAPDDSEWGSDAPARKNNNDEDSADATELARSQESLQSYLHRQALALRLNEEDRAALYALIESLNEDGYLDGSLDELADSFLPVDLEARDELMQQLRVALQHLQQLEPAGVGARNLAECLRLQLLTRAACATRDAALRICSQPLDALARRDTKRLASSCGLNEREVKAAMVLIAQLDPKPGRAFVQTERNIIVPDVLVTSRGRGTQTRFVVQLNQDVMPKLRVHDVYAQAMKGHRGEAHQSMQQRLQEARWLIKNIQQRFDTILRVSNAIVDRQKNFFIHGELAMRPLVLREIADELGLHESTISRVTTAKYMATPFGTFELKYFFGSALSTETGGNASSTAVRALIKQFISAEDVKKPLSDSQIADMLKEQGIECARRTVAKYREAMKIATTTLRKAL
jgi:RNA polymerase sigma-54 factor